MKKNRIQRLQEDMNEDLQKYLDEAILEVEAQYNRDLCTRFLYLATKKV